MAKLKTTTQVITNSVRCSYVHLFEPIAQGEINEGKYTVSLIIPKEDKDTIKVVKQAIKNCFEANKDTKLKGVSIDKVAEVLHDGDKDRPEDEAYKNSYYLSAKSSRKPVIWNSKGEQITDPNEFYSGVWAKADITFYAYDQKINKGISVAINAVVKVKDDDALSGPTVSFSDFDFESDNDESDDWDNI